MSPLLHKLAKEMIPMHTLPTEVLDKNFFDIYHRFLALTGAQVWTKRLRKIEDAFGDKFKRAFHGDDFALERAMHYVRLHMTRFGTLPSVRTPEVYQLYGFIFNVVSVHERLSSEGQKRLVGRLRDGLGSGSLTPLAFEMTTVGALAARHCKIGFSDFETPGGFDFLVDHAGLLLEVECKTLTEDIGRRVKRNAALAIFTRVHAQILPMLKGLKNGVIVKLVAKEALAIEEKTQQAFANSILRALRDGLSQEVPALGDIELTPFEMHASPFGSGPRKEISQDAVARFVSEITGEENREVVAIYTATSSAVILVLTSEKKDRDIHDWLREARDSASTQMSGQRPGVMCVHFDGLNEAELVSLASLEANGLQVGAARILDDAKRRHLVSVVFFARMAERSLHWDGVGVAQRGSTYIVHNPFNETAKDPRANLFSANPLPTK